MMSRTWPAGLSLNRCRAQQQREAWLTGFTRIEYCIDLMAGDGKIFRDNGCGWSQFPAPGPGHSGQRELSKPGRLPSASDHD